ncbi:hypothetical protein JCM3766R1_006087 [Sporobolomyces carnicolor]
MHARLVQTTRLAARFAQTGLQSRVHASKVLNLAATSSKFKLQSRLFSCARIAFQDATPVRSAPVEAESTSFPPSSSSEPSSTTSTTDAPAVAAAPEEEDVTKRTLFVGGLSWNVDNQWLEDEVLKALDLEEGVTSVRVARNHLGKSKGFAFVELSSPELVAKLAGSRVAIDGRDVEFVPSTTGAVKQRAPSSPRVPNNNAGGPRNAPSSTLWVGNVAWSATAESLEDAFAAYGRVVRVHQPVDRETGRSRGIAYVEFGSVEEAKQAYDDVTADGCEVDGRSIRVDFAEGKQSRGDGQHNRNASGGFKPRGQNRDRRGGERRQYQGRQSREEW